MQTSSQVLDLLNDIETRFPVSAWRTGRIDLWPAYRLRLYAHAMDESVLKGGPTQAGGKLRQIVDRAARATWRVPMAALRDFRMNVRPRAGTAALFFSDGVSFVNLGGRWYDRVVEPVAQAFLRRGLESFRLTPLAEAHVPRYAPSQFVQPAIDWIKLRARGRSLELSVPEFAAVQAYAEERGGPIAPSLDWLRIQAGRLDALTRWFSDILHRCGARWAFANTYYSLEGLSLMQAARQLGVRSADLQHGIQGPHHVAYARWQAVPESGYSNLPDEFWVWGSDEATTIEAWNHGRGIHVPRVTGNYWMDRWCDPSDAEAARYVATARAMRTAPAGGKQLLVCGTWGVDEAETDRLIDAVKLLDPSIGIWWRLHPVQARRHAEFDRRLRRHGVNVRWLREVTDAPLYSVLQAADVVLAHSSTVLTEAGHFGVPSVVTSAYGAELHGNLVETGMIKFARETEAIAAAIRGQLVAGVKGAAVRSASRGGLQQLIDAAIDAAGAARETR